MKFTASSSDLRKALAFITKCSDGGMVIPVLGCVMLSAADGKLSMRSTNLNTWGSTSIQAEVATAGETLVNTRILNSLVGKVGKDVTMTMTLDNSVLTVAAGKSRSKIYCLPVADFPLMPEPKNMRSFDIDQKVLATLIDATITAVGVEETRYYLKGIHLSFIGKNALRVAATDGHRASLAYAEVENPGPDDLNAIIPTSAAEIILSLCKSATAQISVSIYDNYVSVRLGSGEEFLTRVIDGTFPDIERIRPSGVTLRPVVDRESLSSALASAVIFASETNGVKLTFADSEMNVEATSVAKGEGRFPVDIDYDGERFEIAVNAKYLATAIASIPSDTIVFGFSNAVAPMSIQSSIGSRNINIVMPIRL